MGFSKQIKALRVLHGLTQQNMADKLDITHRAYQSREQGVIEFRKSEIDEILKIFNKKYEDIFLPS